MRSENDESYMPIKKPAHVLSSASGVSRESLRTFSLSLSLEEFLLPNKNFVLFCTINYIKLKIEKIVKKNFYNNFTRESIKRQR